MKRTLYQPEHEEFRSAFRTLLDREAVPFAADWEAAGVVDRTFFKKAGENGFLGFEAAERYGGLGVSDFRYNAVMSEEIVESGFAGDTFALHNDIVAPYLLNLTDDDQKRRWLPGFVNGDTVTAIAMTEPGAGSDLSSIRTSATVDGDEIELNGSKTFITNGSSCDLAIVLARTGENGGKGTSLVVVEYGTAGFSRGRPLHKVGRKAQDTAELFFDRVRVPGRNIIGERGRGLASCMSNLPRERLSIAVLAVASAERAAKLALCHVKDRVAFGRPLVELQSIRMALAEIHTEVSVARGHVDRCIEALNAGELTAQEAAGVKYWTTDLQCSVIDRCVQMFGGYGYMEEYEIARMWRDARVQRIYGGANEVMKEIVGRALVGK